MTQHPQDITPKTQNTEWGFWGTMGDHAQAAWPIAIAKISDATHNPSETIGLFLDSRYGRQFADSVLTKLEVTKNLPDAIDAAIHQWMNWTIGRATSREYGIPKGMPYLTGFVIHCEIIEYAAA